MTDDEIHIEQWTPVSIEWIDATGVDEGWHEPPEEGYEAVVCVSVGMIHSYDDEVITLVLSWDRTNGHVAGVVTIPRSTITDVRKLR